MNRNIPWDIIAKNLKGKTNPEELDELNAWLDEDETNQKVFNEISRVYESTSSIPSYFEPDKKRVSRKIA